MSVDFIIDEEFRQANRKQTKQERLNLEFLIEMEGPKDGSITVAIIDGNRFLADGHNTFEICQEKGIKTPEPRCLIFNDRSAVLDWIHRHQRARRNLSAEEMAANRADRVQRVSESAKNGKSLRQIAKDEGVSKSQVQKDLRDVESVHGWTPQSEQSSEQDDESNKRLCARCKRVGASPGCKKCVYVRRARIKANRQIRDYKRRVRSEGVPPPPDPATMCCTTCKGSGRIPKVMYGELFAAIVKVTGCDPKVNGSMVGKVVKELLAADPPYTPAEVLQMPAIIKSVWPKVVCSIGVVAKYIGWSRGGAPRSESELDRLRREVS